MASSVTVLSYHRIAQPGCPDLSDSLIEAYPPDFEAQMRYLAAHYTVVSSWDLVRSLRDGYTLPRHAVVITFDDGYRCFMEAAMPVLRRLGLPVTLFVATHVVGMGETLYWWDRLHRALYQTQLREIEVPGVGVLPLGATEARERAYTRMVQHLERVGEEAANALLDSLVERSGVPANAKRHLLDWDELRALEAEGVAIGPHSRHHPILAQAAPGRVHTETYGSWRDLQAQLKRPLPLFCYPNGREHAVNAVAVEAVKRAGMVGAFTTVPGLNYVGRTDPYRMHRVGGSAGETMRHFKVKLSPAGRAYRKLKALVGRAAPSH